MKFPTLACLVSFATAGKDSFTPEKFPEKTSLYTGCSTVARFATSCKKAYDKIGSTIGGWDHAQSADPMRGIWTMKR